jgi:hypothetical protein
MVPAQFQQILEKYPAIYVIVSPPRSSSTAFARVFWEQPTVGYYCHEPFEVVYYNDKDLDSVARKIEGPLDLKLVKKNKANQDSNALVIKEMPYQVGQHFPLLASLAKGPIVFLMRDPRLNIASRMAKKREVGDDPLFPLIESGWELLASQIGYCQKNGIPHIIVDSTDFRNHQESIFSQIFGRFNLGFDKKMLTWSPTDVDLDNLGGQHHHLYRRVLESRGLQPESEPIPPIDSFPIANGFRDHVARCLEQFRTLRNSPARIRPKRSAYPRSDFPSVRTPYYAP